MNQIKTIIGMLAYILVFQNAIAQTNKTKDSVKNKMVQLSEVIVTGDQKTDPILNKVSNEYAKKVLQPKNVADLFNNITGFAVIKRGNYAIDPSFRASNYEQLNIQYDGGTKAMHACPNRMDPITTHIIPEEIERIEIIKGPYSVRYGASFGGIINMVSKRPSLENLGMHGNVSAGYESNGDSYLTNGQLRYVAAKYDLTANFGYRNFGDYTDGNNETVPAAFKSTDYGIKLGYNFTHAKRLQVHWRQSFGRDVKHAGLPMDTDFDDSSILSVDYSATGLGAKNNSFIAKAYYSFVDHLMTNTNRPNFTMVYARSPVTATTLGGKLEFKWNANDKIKWYNGLDLSHIAREGNRTRIVKMNMGTPLPQPKTFVDKIWQDASISDVGLFSEVKYYANTNTIFTIGARYDLVTSSINDPALEFVNRYSTDDRTQHLLSATASVKRILNENHILEIAYGRGVRAANMEERYINHFTIGREPYEYVGNPDLEAEVNNQFEVAFKGKSNSEGFVRKFNYDVSAYYSFFNNYIVAKVDPSINRKFMPSAQPTYAKVFTNLDKAYKTGIELDFKLTFPHDIYWQTAMAYVYTKNKDFNEALPLTPPFNMNFKLGIDKEWIWANVQYNLTSKQDHLATSFGETTTSGYNLLDVRGGWKFKKITLGLACLNILDKGYHNHMNFSFKNQAGLGLTPIQEMGRNFTAFLQYKF